MAQLLTNDAASPRSTRAGHRRCPIGSRSCSDEGKHCPEPLFLDHWRQHPLPIKVARIFNTYGPRIQPDDGRVVSNFVLQALLGRDVPMYGDGSQTRAFCYVEDMIDGIPSVAAD